MSRLITEIVWVAIAGFVAAQAPTDSETSAENARELVNLERLQTQFISEKERARTATAKQFDLLMVQLRNAAQLTEAERLGRVEKWQEEKQAFLDQGELPLEADLAEASWAYGQRLVEAYKPLSRRYNELMKQALSKKQDSWLETLRANKRNFELLHLPGRQQFSENSTWEGSIYSKAGRAWGYRLRVQAISSDAFDGTVAFNTSAVGHPIYEISGSIDGLHLQGRYEKALRGQTINVTMEGMVLGRTLVIHFVTTDAKGKQTPHIALLRRK